MSVTWREWTAEDSAEWIVVPSADDDKYTQTDCTSAWYQCFW